ncbi:hypothetical protein [Neisseria animaloris]
MHRPAAALSAQRSSPTHTTGSVLLAHMRFLTNAAQSADGDFQTA